MRKKFWISLALLLVVPGLLFTVSCAKKKTIQSDVSMSQLSKEETSAQSQVAKQAEQEELEMQKESVRQRSLEEQRLMEQRLREQRLEEQRRKEEAAQREEALVAAAAKKMFETEDIYFDFDSSVLKTEAQDGLKRNAQWLKNNPKASVIIEGHCDERGTNAYNLALGDRRAESAKAFLVDLGISAASLTTISYGEERPVKKGHVEDAWVLNRRAHFVIE